MQTSNRIGAWNGRERLSSQEVDQQLQKYEIFMHMFLCQENYLTFGEGENLQIFRLLRPLLNWQMSNSPTLKDIFTESMCFIMCLIKRVQSHGFTAMNFHLKFCNKTIIFDRNIFKILVFAHYLVFFLINFEVFSRFFFC